MVLVVVPQSLPAEVYECAAQVDGMLVLLLVQDLNNYRGIALSSTVGKVFERVLDGRLREVVEDGVLKETQGGFRSGRSCADQVFVLRNVLEMRRKQGLDSVVAFLDVRKAYDTVWREGLWWKMRRYGTAEKLVRLCMLFYVKVEACVVTGYGLTDWFVVEEGLRQGGVLSPGGFCDGFGGGLGG